MRERIEALCEALGEGPQQLGALVGLSVYSTTRGDLPHAARLARRMLRIAEPLGIAELRVAAHMIIGAAAITSAPTSEACEHLLRAIELAQTAALPPPSSTFDIDVLSTAYSTSSVALTLAGELAASREHIAKSLARAETFDHLTVHGAPNSKPPARSSRRFTLRFADGAARYQPRGPWTKDMTDFLEQRYGLVEGGPYRCELLPILWRSEPGAPHL